MNEVKQQILAAYMADFVRSTAKKFDFAMCVMMVFENGGQVDIEMCPSWSANTDLGEAGIVCRADTNDPVEFKKLDGSAHIAATIQSFAVELEGKMSAMLSALEAGGMVLKKTGPDGKEVN